MNRLLRRAVGLSAVLLTLSVVPIAAQASVAGTWTFTANSPDGVLEAEFVFTQEGTAVSGRGTVQTFGSVQITDGLLEDGLLSFVMHASLEGQMVMFEVEADVDGDEMEGMAYMVGSPEGVPFTGVRAKGE